MTARHSMSALLGLVLFGTPMRDGLAQVLPTDALWQRGAEAYRSLPANPTLVDARSFTDALSYLFAYEQRVARDGGRVPSGVNDAFDWLIDRMDNFKTGKADYAGDRLRDRGMERYKVARNSLRGGQRIWEVKAYISASANLYAYLQCEPNPESDAKSAHDWLVSMRDNLAVSGGAADAITDESWRPTRAKPSIDGRATSTSGGKKVPVGVGARAARESAGGERGTRGDVTPGKAAAESTSTSAAATDTLRGQADTVQQLALRLVALQGANDSLLRVNGELREKLFGSGKSGASDDDVRIGEHLWLQGRLREARDAARRALASDPSSGDAHLLLARIYATASGQNSSPEDRAVVWLALDHLSIAIKQRALDYQTAMSEFRELEARSPTREDLKDRRWLPGQKLRVAFAPYEWIDEETTIRARKE